MAAFQFKRVDIKSYQKTAIPLTTDNIYWKKLDVSKKKLNIY